MADVTPDVTAIVVSYNTRQLTLDCLAALLADLEGIPSEVYVIDNASRDDSVTAIRQRFPSVQVIANEKNRGFGAANNQGIAAAKGKYLLLLNSDAFVEKGAIKKLIAELDTHADVGIAGPQLRNKDGSLQISSYRFPSPLHSWSENLGLTSLFPNSRLFGDYRHWKHDVHGEVDWLIGACLLARRSVIQQIGGFDEAFFMYVEETDLQRRVRDAGHKIVLLPDAKVVHLGGASATPDKINSMSFESIDKYQRKHFGLMGMLSVRASMAFGGAVRGVVWCLCAVLMFPKRSIYWRKARLHWWILYRQLTTWNFA